jgi:hypothetical protein
MKGRIDLNQGRWAVESYKLAVKDLKEKINSSEGNLWTSGDICSMLMLDNMKLSNGQHNELVGIWNGRNIYIDKNLDKDEWELK